MAYLLRLVSLGCALIFLTIGWVWAYYIGLLGMLFGLVGLVTNRLALRIEQKILQKQPSLAQRRLHKITYYLNVAGFGVSLAALVLSLLLAK